MDPQRNIYIDSNSYEYIKPLYSSALKHDLHCIIFYDNLSDLSEKILKYSNDDISRIKISRRGRHKYFKYFNSSEVANFIIEKTFEFNGKRFYWENK